MSSEAQEPAKQAPVKPGAVLIGFLVLLVGEVIILSQSGADSPDVLPEAISEHARKVDSLFWIILGVTGFFFVLTETLLIYFCIKYRAREGGRSEHVHGNHTLELAWTFIPGTILFILAVLQTGTWGSVKYKSKFPDEKDSVVVQVMAKRYEWHFRYPGVDNRFGTADDVTSNGRLHVPVDKNIIVKLRTRDVLHSFWLRNVRLKQDTLPGQTIPQWFNIFKLSPLAKGEDGRVARTEWGTDRRKPFEIACAELCGEGHTNMKGELFVETRAEFEAWLKYMAENYPVEADDPNWKYWRD